VYIVGIDHGDASAAVHAVELIVLVAWRRWRAAAMNDLRRHRLLRSTGCLPHEIASDPPL
jgi:hypothetical protein